MPYTIPTPTSIKTLYPRFVAVADNTVQAWINTAAPQVDTSWLEADYTNAISLLTAHFMVGEGLGTGADAQVAAEGLMGFSQIRSGQLSLSRAANGREDAKGVPSPYNTTGYGIAFYWLARKNRPPAAVSGGNVVSYGDGLYPPLGSPARFFGGY